MNSYFRENVIEEGERNIILQNRCGNRLTLLFFDKDVQGEFLYKPNAFRRKDFRARNFSSRDVYSTLFNQFVLPDTELKSIVDFEYDPFISKVYTETPSMAKNIISFINIADENVFVISAKAPLLIGIKPKKEFVVTNGLLYEKFEDRGEEIVSFVAFAGFEQNRYRVLDNGTHVLQILENETVLIGGEENFYQVDRIVKTLKNLTIDQLIIRNEQIIAPSLNKGKLTCSDTDFQKVIDFNRRIVYSGLDEGGACFGALVRIYMLIWVRDGAMTSSLMGRAGNPDFLKIFAPFLLRNPSITTKEKGFPIRQFLQIVGSRWTKDEDDGIFYAMLTIYSHFVSTGDDSLLQTPEFSLLLDSIDTYLAKAWEPEIRMIGSDTRGESPLFSNPYYGYDVVCGKIEPSDGHEGGGLLAGQRIMSRNYSLYLNVNTYSIMLMALRLLQERPDCNEGRSDRYRTIADTIQNTVKTDFVDKEGTLYTAFIKYNDGSAEWMPYGKGIDYWEYAWACSLGPFFPAPELQLKSAHMVKDRWRSLTEYGFCPWNTVANMLHEYGMSDDDYVSMLRGEIDDAKVQAKKYPMKWSLGEYIDCADKVESGRSWRALPFTAGSFIYSMTGLLLKSLPQGIAVRDGSFVNKVSEFCYKCSRIEAVSEGDGEQVGEMVVNGELIEGTLQIPEKLLRPGKNSVHVKRVLKHSGFRIYSSTATMLDCEKNQSGYKYTFETPYGIQIVVDGYESLESFSASVNGKQCTPSVKKFSGTDKHIVDIKENGKIIIEVKF